MKQPGGSLTHKPRADTWFPDSPETAEDDYFVQAALSNPQAFDNLYRCYSLKVYRYLKLRLNTADEAADLTQQVFLQALEAIPKYKPHKTPFAAWLFSIARNASIDKQRRKRPDVELSLLPEGLEPIADSDLAEQTAQQEIIQHLQHALARLNHEQREILALRFAGGLTCREIGATIGKNEAAVRKQLTRMLSRLKESFLEGYDEA